MSVPNEFASVIRRTVLRRTAGLALSSGLAGCTWLSDPSNDGGQSGSGATLADARLVLEPYRDPQRALDDGYESTDECVEGLGIPFVHPGVSGRSYDEPPVLLYELVEGGDLALRGAEWFVPADEVTDSQAPPALFAGDDRRTFDGPAAGDYSGQPRHYGLHVWLFADNPDGTFAERHPDVECAD